MQVVRTATSEVTGFVPALAGTVNRALRGVGGSLSLAAPNTVINVPISGTRRFAARSWPLARLRAVARAADATVNDVVLAMSSGALRAFLSEQGGHYPTSRSWRWCRYVFDPTRIVPETKSVS